MAGFTMNVRSRFKYHGYGRASTPDFGKEDKNMKNENRNEEAVSPVIATILMVAITVVLAGVLYVWASSLAEGNTDGNLALYVMDAEDANGSPSDGIEDNLVRVTMTQGSDINWAAISVKISVNNGAPVTCDNPGATGGGCVLVEFGDTTDQVWSVGDGVTIAESSALCAAGEVCSISVTITDTQEGKTLDESSAVAE
jgi:flagellin-like protein